MRTSKIVEGAEYDTEVSYDDDGILILQGDEEVRLASDDEAEQMIAALTELVAERKAKAKG